MAFTNSTTHYGLPQWIGTDKPTYLVDQNNAYATIDTQLYTASTDAASAVATANSASASATTAAENAATALSTANTADGKADSAITQAELAQTAAGAAQTAAAAAQTAAAANNITNLAPAYDSTLTYNVDDLVTAEGKLYKCIVAVTTPMDFDINYWDDVTTSEVYAKINNDGYMRIANLDSNSNISYHDEAQYLMLEGVINSNKKRRLIMQDDNILKLSKTDDGVSYKDSYLIPTLRVGDSYTIISDSIAFASSTDTLSMAVYSQRLIKGDASNYSITLKKFVAGNPSGISGTITTLTSPTVLLDNVRDGVALIRITDSNIAAAQYPINSIAWVYVEVTITRNV